MRLSGVVISFNEEKNIERCLESLAFCDEIVLLDSESSDATRDLAKKYTDRIFTSPWKGYVAQKNDAVALARGEWIVSIDADEQISPALREEILSRLRAEPSEAAYAVPRKTIHSGKWIRYGGWYPNRLVRVFNKKHGTWIGGAVHEKWDTSKPVGILENDILHYSFNSITDQVRRNDHYSTLGAQDLKSKGRRFSLFWLLMKPISKFLETFVLKRGFLDGYRGFFISISAAYSVFLKWAKLWEIEQGEKKKEAKVQEKDSKIQAGEDHGLCRSH